MCVIIKSIMQVNVIPFADEILNNFECSDPVGMPLKRVGAGDTPRTRAKKRWRVVIEQQIMLNRMEKLNKSLQSKF